MRERDLVGRDGLFVAEGRVVLEKAVQAIPDRILSVVVGEIRIDAWPRCPAPCRRRRRSMRPP